MAATIISNSNVHDAGPGYRFIPAKPSEMGGEDGSACCIGQWMPAPTDDTSYWNVHEVDSKEAAKELRRIRAYHRSIKKGEKPDLTLVPMGSAEMGGDDGTGAYLE